MLGPLGGGRFAELNKIFKSICHLISFLMVIGILSCSSPGKIVPPIATDQTAPSVNAVEPYKFEVGSITVAPREAQAGMPVLISVPVRNVGSARNAYVGTLYVDGQEYGTKDITLDPGSGGSLVYQVSNLSAGSHKIAVGGSEGAVQVYNVQRYTIANTQVYMPHYAPLEYTPAPPLPYISSDSFAPPVTPFYITQINFRYPFPQSFKILDANNKQIYSADAAYNESAYVPNIEVNGSFSVEMQTNQPAADVRSEFFGFSTWELVVAYFWPEVSTVEGIQKRFSP